MLRRARLCHSVTVCRPSVYPSVCLSVCDVQLPRSRSLEYFENYSTAQGFCSGWPNMVDVVQREQRQN